MSLMPFSKKVSGILATPTAASHLAFQACRAVVDMIGKLAERGAKLAECNRIGANS